MRDSDDKTGEKRCAARLRPHRLTVSFDAPPLAKHWNRNSVETHLLNSLSLLFPFIEHFFVDVMKDALRTVQDPDLTTQIKGFIAQEVHHAHQHKLTFDVLEQQGFAATALADRCEHLFRRFIGPRLSLRRKLSLVAALEHFTASFAEFAFTAQTLAQADPRMRTLFLWHAAEEIEHKNVAYDLLNAVDRSYALRVSGMALAFPMLVSLWYGATLALLWQDGPLRPLRASRQYLSAVFARRVPVLTMVRAIAEYLRPNFHPSQHDNFYRTTEYFAAERPAAATPGA